MAYENLLLMHTQGAWSDITVDDDDFLNRGLKD